MSKEFQTPEKIAGNEVYLMINKKFLEDVAKEVLRNPDPLDETGGLILGVREVRKGNQLFIVPLGYINTKDPTELERRHAHLTIGGPITNLSRVWQVENWQTNYPNTYEDFSPNMDNPSNRLTILGIWHKHPGSMIGYSGEDSQTVDNILRSSKKNDFIFPVAILRSIHEAGSQIPDSIRIKPSNDSYVDIKFYYRTRNGNTYVLKPEIYGKDFFPHLYSPPWYVDNPRRFKKEIATLEAMGLRVGVKHVWRFGLRFPESWLTVSKPESSRTLFVRMSHSFDKDGIFFATRQDPDKETGHGGTVFFLENSSSIGVAIKSLIF